MLAVEHVVEVLPVWWQEKLLLDFPLTALTKGIGIYRSCLLSHSLFYLLAIPTAPLVLGSYSVFLPRNMKQQKHFVHWSRFSGRGKPLLQASTLSAVWSTNSASRGCYGKHQSLQMWCTQWQSENSFDVVLYLLGSIRYLLRQHNPQTRALSWDERYTFGLVEVLNEQ